MVNNVHISTLQGRFFEWAVSFIFLDQSKFNPTRVTSFCVLRDYFGKEMGLECACLLYFALVTPIVPKMGMITNVLSGPAQNDSKVQKLLLYGVAKLSNLHLILLRISA